MGMGWLMLVIGLSFVGVVMVGVVVVVVFVVVAVVVIGVFWVIMGVEKVSLRVIKVGVSSFMKFIFLGVWFGVGICVEGLL